MSTSKELADLQNRKSELEKESSSLKEEQNSLVERVRILEEKIAIGELENTNRSTRDAIAQLESKVNGLAQRLEEVTHEPDSHKQEKIEPEPVVAQTPETPEMTSEATPETTETMFEEPVEEEVVTETAFEEPMTIEQEKIGENKKHDKKKRKFF